MISIGIILGGGELARSRVDIAISQVSAFFRGKKKGDFGSLNMVFHVPGSIVKPNYVGVRTAKFSKKEKMLMIQVAVPEEMKESEQLLKFLLDSVHEGIEIAKPKFQKAKIEYPVESYLELVSQAKKQMQF